MQRVNELVGKYVDKYGLRFIALCFLIGSIISIVMLSIGAEYAWAFGVLLGMCILGICLLIYYVRKYKIQLVPPPRPRAIADPA